MQRSLLVLQVGLCVVLLVGAGLFVRSLQRIDRLDLGLDRDNVLVTTVDFTGSGRAPESIIAFYESALERVRALPGVDRVSLSTGIPLRSARSGGRIQLPAGADSIRDEHGSPSVNYVSPDFFATTGTRIVQGRDFLPAERHDAKVILINETMARLAWPGRSPVGECVPFRGEDWCATVIGVVENARRAELREPEYLIYYRPLSPVEPDSRVLLIRVDQRARIGAATLRRALLELDPTLPYLHVETLGAALDPQIRPWRLGASVFTVFGALAALLAAIGLYSALAYATTQRTREIGIRLAIGARAMDVATLVMRDGMRVALAGIAVGLAAALIAGRWIEELLFEVSPRDWSVLAAVSAALLFVVLLAGWGPARRAMRVDPTVAMRAE
jgi:predicted permease